MQPPPWQGQAQASAAQQQVLPGPRPPAGNPTPAKARPSAVPANGNTAMGAAAAAAAAARLAAAVRQPPVGFVIRPQMGKRKLPEPAAPAYLKVAGVSAAQPVAPSKPTGGGQKLWPPSLRAYVERAFSSCSGVEGRVRLQAALKQVCSVVQRACLACQDCYTSPLEHPAKSEPKSVSPARPCRACVLRQCSCTTESGAAKISSVAVWNELMWGCQLRDVRA